MSAIPGNDQHGGEALQAAQYAKARQRAPSRGAASGSAQIESVVLPFLEQAKNSLQGTSLRLDFGVRKFDVATGENWSVYFRVVNPKAHKASAYYIVDLSARSPLILTVDSLDIGSGVRRREVWDETLASHDDVTDQVLSKLLDRAVQEAGQP
jgi:hypothetical protein